MHKSKLRIDVVEENVCKQGMACIYANLIGGQDELVFDGGSFVLNGKAQITTLMPQFVEELRFVTIKTTQIAATAAARAHHARAVGVGSPSVRGTQAGRGII